MNTPDTESGRVESEISDGVATITFSHPKSNSLPGKLLAELAAQVTSAGQDANAEVIVLRSEGEGVFCSGASFAELQAIKDAEANLRLNRLPEGQVRFIAGRVEEVIRLKADTTVDAVVLDPPRQGCPPRVLSAVFEQLRPSRAVYVSCNPDALSEELPGILKAGYGVRRVQAVDMFPHTNHIETVMTFERG